MADKGMYDVGTGSIKATNITCSGSEPSLTECPTASFDGTFPGCSHDQDVAVQCAESGKFAPYTSRLI